MVGGIYSDQKCPVCGSKFIDNHKDGLLCPKHKEIRASSLSVRFKKTHQRFKNYDEADQFLSFLRSEYRRGKYDERDYQKDDPLSVANLTQEWLEKKEGKVKFRTLQNFKGYAHHWNSFFGNKNIKDIDYAHIEDFLDSLTLSNKTKHNINAALHNFFVWVWKRNKKIFSISDFPEFPTVQFVLGRRKIVSKEVQTTIVEEIKRICKNPKVYLGIKWLCTYGNVRPGELLKLEEGNIDIDIGRIWFWDTKENNWKWVTLLDEDVELLKTFPLALPSLHFFRHTSMSGVHEGRPFGQKQFYNWWKKACENLGVEGVDLYGGTRHSSATALNRRFSPEEIKKHWTKHTTSKAFDRYLTPDEAVSKELYIEALPNQTAGKELVKNLGGSVSGKLLKLKN